MMTLHGTWQEQPELNLAALHQRMIEDPEQAAGIRQYGFNYRLLRRDVADLVARVMGTRDDATVTGTIRALQERGLLTPLGDNEALWKINPF